MNIYIGNLPHKAEEQELKALFAQYGEVKSVKIVKDGLSGTPRGFAFVEMRENGPASQAIKELNMKPFGGKKLNVREGKPKNNSPKVYNSFSSNYGYEDRNKF